MNKTEFIQSLAIGLTPIISIGILKLLGKFKTFQINNIDTETIEILPEKEYRKYSQLFFLIFVLSMLVNVVLVFLALDLIAKLYYSFLNQYMTLRLPEITYGIPAIFISIVLSNYTCDQFMRKFLKEKYSGYIKTGDDNYGINEVKIFNYMKFGLIFCSIFIFTYELRSTSYLIGEYIHINKFGTIGTKIYKVEDVREISRKQYLIAPNGNIVYRSNFNVYFIDGFIWNIDDEGDGKHFVEIISKKLGQPITNDN